MTDPTERELTHRVSLVNAGGALNPAAIGYARSPLVDTSGIDGRRAWGRNKRWEYWNVMTPTHILSLTVSSLDYAAVHEVWVLDRSSERTWGRSATVVPSRDVDLPATLGSAPALARAKDLAISITPGGSPRVGEGVEPERVWGGDSWRLFAEIPGVSFDVTVVRPAGHDCLAVVVPWSRRRFQYTVKDVALPATGVLIVDGATYDIPEGSWAVLDHGRGRWPYNVRWNWGAGAGVAGGRTLGIQVGGRWTDGTGSTENALMIDGELHKISAPLAWEYDLAKPLRPWRVHGGALDATFTPFYNKRSEKNLGVVASRTDQCFGEWSGRFGDTVFDGIEGFAEDVRNRW